jgi:hypothetical protein
MQILFLSAKFLSAACFCYYGLCLLVSQDMVAEFARYGLSRYRRLVGWLQLAGSLALIAGAYLPLLDTLAALGLTALMGLGVVARVKARDSILEMLPAFLLLILNAYIVFASTLNQK